MFGFVCIHSTILLYVLFILSCTTCYYDLCAVYLYYSAATKKYYISLKHRRNWFQPPLTTSHRPSRANGGAPVLAKMVTLLCRRLITSVHPTPIPPTSHQFHLSNPSHPENNQTAHKSQCFLIQSSRYNTIHTIRYNPSNKLIQPSQSLL